jgi:hypothetical protein
MFKIGDMLTLKLLQMLAKDCYKDEYKIFMLYIFKFTLG